MVKDFNELLRMAQEKGKVGIAVAVAQDREVLAAIKEAFELGIIAPILVGNKDEIQRIASEIDFDLEGIEVIHQDEDMKAARVATELVSRGKADILMKGLVETSTIMKQVLDKDFGLRTENVISHVAIFSIDTYHKLFMVTDPAMILAPNLNQKKQIIENAVKLARALGVDRPKVGVLAAKEKIDPKMEATVHAGQLKEMNLSGHILDCIVDGPFALDNAINKESAHIKGIDSPVAGDADILLVPNIESGNILYKSLTFLGGAKAAGIITGARAPIVLTSRADDHEAKLNSILVAALMSNGG